MSTRYLRFAHRCLVVAVASLTIVSASYAQAPGVIEGTVADATGAPVAAVRVTVTGPGGERVAVSDATGRYRVERLAAGRYAIRASHPGFSPATAQADVSADAVIMNLTLGAVVATDAVSVTGTFPAASLDAPTEAGSRLGLTARETPATITVVPFAQAQERGLSTTVEVLNRVPAVSSGLAPGNPGVVAVRGFSGGAVSLLFDGNRITTSTMVTRNYDSWTFDRIEVLKGPASVLYGEGALAGAINFVSKRPDFTTRKAEALVSYGSFESARAAVGAAGPIGDARRAAYRADAVFSTHGGHVDNRFDTLALTGAVDLKLGANATVGVSVDHFQDSYDVAYYGAPLVPRSVARTPSALVTDSRDFVIDEATRTINYNVTDGVMESRSTWLRARLDWRLGGSWRLLNEAYAYDALRTWENAEAYAYSLAAGQLTRSTVAIQHDHQFYGNRLALSSDTRFGARRNRFTTGVEVNRNDFFNPRRFGATTNVDPQSPDRGVFPEDNAQNFPGAGNRVNFDTGLNLVSLFAEDAFTLAPRVTAIGGVRYDRLEVDRAASDLNTGINSTFARTFEPVSYRAGLVVDVLPKTQLFGQYTSAVAPVATVLLISQTNAAFDLTTGMSTEGGVKSTFADGRIEASGSVFKIEQDDILTRDPNNANVTIQGGSQATTGVEFAVTANLTGKLSIDVNGAIMNARFVELIEAGGLNRAGNVPPNVPEQTAGLWVAYRLGARPVTVAGGLRYQNGFYTNNANTIRVNGFTIVDAQVGVRLGRGDLVIRGRNLTDTIYADWSGASAGQFMLGPPRAFEASYHVRF